MMKKWFILVSAFFFAAVLTRPATAQTAQDFFQQNCTACHTIGGGRLVGPDLKDVTQKKDREWLEHFMQNPKAVIDSGDPYALQIRREANGIIMPKITGMTPQMADALLNLIEAESKVSRSRFGGVKVPEQPFTAEDLRIGTQIFYGNRKLSKGGPACISCHTLGTVTGLGGGRLGPDLTLVFQRLGGRTAVGSWLSAPATPTMQAVFRNHPIQSEEIQPLLALFEDAGQHSQPAGSATQVNFFLLGFAGAALGLALMGWIWRRRIRTVRRSLVQAVQRGES
jgi:mono/diheme cytochrome c family protein